MPRAFHDDALLLIGHGSTRYADAGSVLHGHAKTLHATTAIAKDYWDAYKVLGAGSQASDLAGAGGVGEWNPGF